ncbi:MAG: hypothetical protein HY688_01285 [Chloroflexi bacterium]|nr:hypothetical protein [Chloroflexota bacterium]
MQPRQREEVLNVALALALHRHGIVAAPETLFQETLERGRAMPDVLVDYQGLRTVIEGKVDTAATAEVAARRQAFARVEQGIAHICIAVMYPESLRTVPFSRLLDELEVTPFRIVVFTEASENEESAWEDADIPHIGEVLRRTYETLAEQDVVKKAVAIIRLGTEEFSILFDAGSLDRAIAALGIRQLTPAAQGGEEDTDGEVDGPE